jgi:hypothetical protein
MSVLAQEHAHVLLEQCLMSTLKIPVAVESDTTVLISASCLEVELATAELEKYKCPSSEQLLAELTQAGGETLVSVIHKLINSLWYKEELPDQ